MCSAATAAAAAGFLVLQGVSCCFLFLVSSVLWITASPPTSVSFACTPPGPGVKSGYVCFYVIPLSYQSLNTRRGYYLKYILLIDGQTPIAICCRTLWVCSTNNGCVCIVQAFREASLFFWKFVIPWYQWFSFIPIWCPNSTNNSSLSPTPFLLLNGIMCCSITRAVSVTLNPISLHCFDKA